MSKTPATEPPQMELSAAAGPVGVRLGSGGPYEQRWGYSRVVRVGPLAVTAGCTSVIDGQVTGVGDAGAQAATALHTALGALARVGLRPGHVVRSAISIVDRADADAVGRAHGDVFGAIRPAATMLVVAGLVDPRMLVEIELTAWAEPPGAPDGVPRMGA